MCSVCHCTAGIALVVKENNPCSPNPASRSLREMGRRGFICRLILQSYVCPPVQDLLLRGVQGAAAELSCLLWWRCLLLPALDNHCLAQHSHRLAAAHRLWRGKHGLAFGSANLAVIGCWDWVLSMNELFVCLLGKVKVFKKILAYCSRMNIFSEIIFSLYIYSLGYVEL